MDFTHCSCVSIVDIELVNTSLEAPRNVRGIENLKANNFIVQSKWKQKIENGSEKLLFSKLDAFLEKFGFSCIVWWRFTALHVINSSFVEFVTPF